MQKTTCKSIAQYVCGTESTDTRATEGNQRTESDCPPAWDRQGCGEAWGAAPIPRGDPEHTDCGHPRTLSCAQGHCWVPCLCHQHLNHQDFCFFLNKQLKAKVLLDWDLPWSVFVCYWVLFGKIRETQKKGDLCLTQLTLTSSLWLLTTNYIAARGRVCMFLNGAWFMLPSSMQDSAKHYFLTKIRITYSRAYTSLSQISISLVFSSEGAYFSQYFCVKLFD